MIQVLKQGEMNKVTKGLRKYLLHAGQRFQPGPLQLGEGMALFYFIFFKKSLEKKIKRLG